MQGVYVTRDTESLSQIENFVNVWPATVGIRKWNGCIWWGAAWAKNYWTLSLFSTGRKFAQHLNKDECHKRFGFYPRPGTAWWVSGKGKRSKVDIDFSD